MRTIIMKILSKIPFHSFLFAVYPVLLMYWANSQQVALNVIWRPTLFLILLSIFLIGLLFIPMRRDLDRAALATTVLLIWFLFYGHLANILVGWTGIEILGRSKFLLPVTGIIVIGLLWILSRKPVAVEMITFVNIVAILGFFLISIQIILGLSRTNQIIQTHNYTKSSIQIDLGSQARDIYIIILDSYARQDVLSTEFGYDNQVFLDDLIKRGFKVSTCSVSNYNSTDYSLASTFNLEYFNPTLADYAESGIGYAEVQKMLRHGVTRTQLESLGYSTWSFETGYSFADWSDADHFLTYESEQSSDLNSPILRPFESLLIKSSIFRTVLQYISAHIRTINDKLLWDMKYPFQTHIMQTKYALKKLEEMPLLPGPKLVHVHLMVPHKPLVFSESGEILNDSGYYGNEGDAINETYFKNGYVSQIKFINHRLLTIIDALKKESRIEPIIIVFSDHGYYYSSTHFENLIAILIPDASPNYVLPSSNVNIFRSIFNEVFDTSYPLLQDLSFNVNNGEHGEKLFTLLDYSTLETCKNPK